MHAEMLNKLVGQTSMKKPHINKYSTFLHLKYSCVTI